MTPPQLENIPYPLPAVFEVAAQILPSLGYPVERLDQANGVIEATKIPTYVFSRGETITIRLVAMDEHWTSMMISSSIAVFVYDAGSGPRNIGKVKVRLMSELERLYPQQRATTPAPPPPAV